MRKRRNFVGLERISPFLSVGGGVLDPTLQLDPAHFSTCDVDLQVINFQISPTKDDMFLQK
jgi:hypothetical protein